MGGKQLNIIKVIHYPMENIICGGMLQRSMTQGVIFKGMKSVGMKSGWD